MSAIAQAFDRENPSSDNTRPNDEISVHWYRRTADAGQPEAMGHLAGIHYDGSHGLHKDDALAVHWLVWQRELETLKGLRSHFIINHCAT